MQSKQGGSKVKKRKLGSYPYITVVFSITLSLFVLGLFGLIAMHGTRLTEEVHHHVTLNVEIQNGLSDSSISAIENNLKTSPWLYKGPNHASFKYVSPEQARKEFNATYGEDFASVLDENPLHASYILTVSADMADTVSLNKIKRGIESMPGINKVYYNAGIEKVIKNLRTISMVLIGFAVILILASILLINNTIKLALYSQRFLIRSMQLVGATGWFIRWPFLGRAVLQGFISGVLSASALFGILNYIYNENAEIAKLRIDELNYAVLGGLILLGAIIGLFSAWRAISKYLKMSLDELY